MIKITGCILLIITGCLTGLYISDKIRHRLYIEKLLYRMYCEIEILLNCSQLTYCEIISRLVESENYKELDFLNVRADTENIRKEVLDSLEESHICDEIITANTLKNFFSCLGTSDIDGQISYVRLAEKESRECIAVLEEKTLRQCKLAKAMGVLGGAFAAILFV